MGKLQNSYRRIGILGHVGTGNLGDEAIIAAVIQNLRERCPQVEICAFTTNAEDTQKRHGVMAFPLRRGAVSTVATGSAVSPVPDAASPLDRLKHSVKRISAIYRVLKAIHNFANASVGVAQELGFIAASYWRVKGVDLLIVAGSHQLNDFVGGPWAFPYTLLKWALLARMSGARVALLSVGAGPIDSRLARQFVRWTLALACYRSYRDERSRDLVLEIGASGENLYIPDLAFSLSMPRLQLMRQASRPVVGINPLPFFDRWYWYKSDDELYREYIRKLAEVTEFIIDNGYAVWLFPTQLRADPAVIKDVRQAMRERYQQHLLDWSVQTFDEMTAGINACRLIIATRYHGILISLVLEKPVLALAYHGKSQDLMALLGQGKYALDAACWEPHRLADLFIEIERERDQVTEQIASRLPAIRRMLGAQYDAVLGQNFSRRESITTERFEVQSGTGWN